MQGFKSVLKENKRKKQLDKILKSILKENIVDLTEGSCFSALKSAIVEFIEIKEFKPLIDPRKKGITINGEFRGGESGSKHVIMNCSFKLDRVIEDLNKNIKTINDSL